MGEALLQTFLEILEEEGDVPAEVVAAVVAVIAEKVNGLHSSEAQFLNQVRRLVAMSRQATAA